MFAKFFALFALLAVAFAAPAPNPKPQVVAYTGLDYAGYPAASAFPYSPYSPVAYSAYPGAVYLR